MDPGKYWNVTETNTFLYERLKEMGAAAGFVRSPRKRRHLVKIAEHFVQIVYPELVRGRTRLHVMVSPAGSFANYYYAKKTVPVGGYQNGEEYTSYLDLAEKDPETGKEVYETQRVKDLWEEVVRPRFQQEVFDCLERIDFDGFMLLSGTMRLDGIQYCSCPGNDDALRFLAMGYGELWRKNLVKGLSLVQRALDGLTWGMEQSERLGQEVSVEDRENHAAAQEVLAMLQGDDGMDRIMEKLKEIEQKALNRAWGVTPSWDGRTTFRVRRKALL